MPPKPKASQPELQEPHDETIPTYRINLAHPPSQRYTQLSQDFSPKMHSIVPLFTSTLSTLTLFTPLRNLLHFLARHLLRHLYSSEETEELRGIAEVSGVEMYLLVALNVVLDSLLGCTSGGCLVRTRNSNRKRKEGEGKEGGGEGRMMHFRVQDWGMDELRQLLVVLEFVRSDPESPDGEGTGKEKVIARCVTYAGFTGVLTGVREGLSMSLNFRPTNSSSRISQLLHQFLVLLGFRPSIASILRSTLLSECPLTKDPGEQEASFTDITTHLSTIRSSPCYLILCDGHRTTVIEKDLHRSTTRSSSEFLIQTNHDTSGSPTSQPSSLKQEVSTTIGMESLLSDSRERQECVQKKWDKHVRRCKGEVVGVGDKTLRRWVSAFPTMNECTHFGCVLDPETGRVVWLERGVLDEDEVEDGHEE